MHQLKPVMQFLVRPLARFVARRGGTANQVTMAAMLGSIGVGLVVATVGPWLSLVWLLMPMWLVTRMGLNAVDGLLAREHHQASRLGAYLNELADVVSDTALLLPLATLSSFSPALVTGIALLASWTELAGALGPMIGASRRHEGPMGKADRALVLGLIGGWVSVMGGALPGALAVQWLLLALLGLTIVRRVVAGLAEVGEW